MKTSFIFLRQSFCVFFFGMPLAVTAHEQDGELTFDMLHNSDMKEGHLHASWESRYISEGRDNLDGDSLITTSAEFSWDLVTAGLWYGGSPGQSYNELGVGMQWAF